jgi:hypothetical protein
VSVVHSVVEPGWKPVEKNVSIHGWARSIGAASDDFRSATPRRADSLQNYVASGAAERRARSPFRGRDHRRIVIVE